MANQVVGSSNLSGRAIFFSGLTRFRKIESSHNNKIIKVVRVHVLEVARKFYKWPSHLPQ